MKLQELAAISPTKQAAKVFESYFGNTVPLEQLNRTQARHMLNRVRSLIAEHRRQPSFHRSEQNPAYLKLVVLEQGLSSKLKEVSTVQVGQVAGAQADKAAAIADQPANTMAMNPADISKQKALQTAQLQQRNRQIDDAIKAKQKELQDLQKQKASPIASAMAESRRYIKEDEVQQAQVVLASQDMVDQIQKMIEQVTSMQFKDLPALVDQVKTTMGPDQAMKFNQDVTGALTGLTQNLQGSKTQLEGALGVVTGQAPVVPGEDMGAPEAELGAEELPPAPEGEEELDIDAEIEEPTDAKPSVNDLGRARR